MKLCTKFQGKPESRSGTGAQGTRQLMIFTCFASTSPSKFSWHYSFNLARITCSFYWCYIFSFVITFFCNHLLKISIQKEKHLLLYRHWWTGIFTGIYLCRSLFLIKFYPLDLNFVKKRLHHRCFLWILHNFNCLFYRALPVAASKRGMEKVKKSKLENSVNVQKQPPEKLYKKAFLKVNEMG